MPGTAALNQGGNAQTKSVSCASAGSCSAGGYYADSSGDEQAFLGSETNGTWGAAEEVPGTAALNTGGNAQTKSVSCASARNCSAGGYYTDGSAHQQAFVVVEKHGTWGTAEEVPGTAALNTGGRAAILSVSCASARNCSAGGYYTDSSAHQQASVVVEKHGTWGTAEEVPGTAALNTGGRAAILSVSCASAGSCSAGGDYTDGSGAYQALVVRETKGTWRTAKELPGIATLNKGGSAAIYSMSCASAGNCSAGGRYYSDNSGDNQAFIASSRNGTWGKAREVPGTATLNTGGRAAIFSVSCASARNCSAGGFYADSSAHLEPFVVGETNGTWGKAEEVPGIAALNDRYAQINSVSCPSAGNCSAGGEYMDSSFHYRAFIVSRT